VNPKLPPPPDPRHGKPKNNPSPIPQISDFRFQISDFRFSPTPRHLYIQITEPSTQAAAPNQIDEFTTLTGRTYRKCRISQVHPDGISFFHSKGTAKVLFADLSDSWKKKLGYNAKRAEDFQKEATTRKFIEQERLTKAREQAVAQTPQPRNGNGKA
jgi:hypothetical protein